ECRYFLGPDPSRWRTHVPRLAGATARGVLPGVDLAFGGEGAAPEYRFLVAPGAAGDGVDLVFEGAAELSVDERGDLVVGTRVGRLRHTRPVAWQDGAPGRREVAAAFEVRGGGRVRLTLGPRDASLPLVVDPRVEFSTYFPYN